ncbi:MULTISPECIES: DUF6054 family protein [Microbacterium]|uniref:DUF6054 family protein n=1 Tax=Microbacterium TaxID=33882 RepID=UPI00344D6955
MTRAGITPACHTAVMLQTMEISLTPFDAARIVLDHVQSSGMTVECVGQHATATESGHQMALLIFEKYYMRTSSRASLTVVIENLAGPTKAVFRGSGGARGRCSASTGARAPTSPRA